MIFSKTALRALCLALPFVMMSCGANAGNPPKAAAVGRQSGARLATPVSLPWKKVLPGSPTNYEFATFSGSNNREYLLQEKKLDAGGFQFLETSGRSGRHYHPCLMLRDIRTGRGVAASLAYSGNWKAEIKAEGANTVFRLAASPQDLKPFDTLGGVPIPGALVSEFTGDWDYGAQPIVRYIREKLLRKHGPDWPPVQFNTWYSSYDKWDESTLRKIIPIAAELGCELFTVDAGWYGGKSPAGTRWSLALGDWTVDERRVPSGLQAISKEAHKAGMKFGLWVEIECASTNSPVALEHPDWFLRDGTRLFSSRAPLNFGKPEVLAWAKLVIDRLVTDYELDYLKMDYNNNNAFDTETVSGEQDLQSAHYRGLIALWKYLREKHPNLIVENCSSGSLRHDVMTAALTDTAWVSDNITNNWNLAINFGATYLFPPETCNHWTVKPTNDGGALDLESQFTVNMMGHFGLSGQVWDWSAQTRKVAAERIAFYKDIRRTLTRADVLHLTRQANPTLPQTMQAALYVDAANDEALLFAFQGGDPSLKHRIRLRGLRPESKYRVILPPIYLPQPAQTGQRLMTRGMNMEFPHKGASAVVRFEAVRQ